MQRAEAIERIQGPGFIAALDQSGGSTPGALEAYGVPKSEFEGSDEKMFDLVHAMRTRFMTNPAFDKRISGTILFEGTMENRVEGVPTGHFLSKVKNIVPFVKVDEGLAQITGGVQLMKEMKGLGARLQKAVDHGMFGTKTRSVIHEAVPRAIGAVVKQQFEVAQQIMAVGLMPIIEPEVSIDTKRKITAEWCLRGTLLHYLSTLGRDQQVMLKLTLPYRDDYYESLVQHPNVLRVVALSGGYSREEATNKLSRNHGVTASFNRGLSEGLRVDMNEADFTKRLDSAIQGIFDASNT